MYVITEFHCTSLSRLPWNWGRADRLGRKWKTDRCLLHRKGWLGKKKEGRVSIVSRAGSGFLLLSKLWSRVGCMGVAAIHLKRTMASDFIGLPTGPKASLPDHHEVRVTKKHPSVWGLFSPRTARLYPKKIPQTSKNDIKTKKAYGRELIPCQALRQTSVRVPIGRAFCMIYAESMIFSMFSDWPSLSRRAKEGQEKRKKGYLHLNMPVQSFLRIAIKTQSTSSKRWSLSALSKSNLSVRRAFLPELHHSS